MGTIVEISSTPPDREAVLAAFEAIDQVDRLMSIYKSTSEVSILNSQGKASISPQTREVIEAAIRFSQITNGAFDITVKPLVDLWKEAAAQNQIPSQQDIAELLQLIGGRILLKEGVARFVEEGMGIDLGGIAKGYAVDRAIGVLIERGISRALVNAGGDLYALGRWTVGIQHPQEEAKIYGRLTAKDEAVATSGSYWLYSIIQGRKFSHIIDPRTGIPVQDTPISVTIIAADATTADALATGVFVLGPKEGIKLINKLHGVEGMIISQGMKVVTSRGFIPD
jgi:thiamine biosynthesis lipoprotein